MVSKTVGAVIEEALAECDDNTSLDEGPLITSAVVEFVAEWIRLEAEDPNLVAKWREEMGA
jgi:hypothetical protein